MSIVVHKPFIKRRDMDAVLSCLVSDRPGPGGEADGLIQIALEHFDLEAGAALRELPRALRLAIRALDLHPGARVGVSALSPQWYTLALREESLEMVLVDVEGGIPCLSMDSLKSAHAKSPLDALIVNYCCGSVPPMAEIGELGIPVIEDVSEAVLPKLWSAPASSPQNEELAGEERGFGATGVHGRVILMGLEERHWVTAGGGALVLIRQKQDAQRLEQHLEQLPQEVLLPDLNAALARAQFRELPEFFEKCASLWEAFFKALKRGGCSGFSNPRMEKQFPICFPVLASSSMNELMAWARKKGCDTEIAFRSSIIATMSEEEAAYEHWPNARQLSLRTVLFPLHSSLSGKDAELIQKVLASLP